MPSRELDTKCITAEEQSLFLNPTSHGPRGQESLSFCGSEADLAFVGFSESDLLLREAKEVAGLVAKFLTRRSRLACLLETSPRAAERELAVSAPPRRCTNKD